MSDKFKTKFRGEKARTLSLSNEIKNIKE